jgi:arabinogalactan endo-1,4-beta-galactosidase
MPIVKLYFVIFSMLALDALGSCNKKADPIIGNPLKDTLLFKDFAMGVDLSYVNQIEDHGGIYKEDELVNDPFQILKDHGANVVRLRLWHNPQWIKTVYDESTPLYSGFDDVAKSIKRAKDIGLAVNLDFHYSDTWADPGSQNVPEAWKDITNIDVLCDSVYNYTYSVLSALNQKGLLPEMIQIGNETNCGMMITNILAGFPQLNACNGNWANLGKVINSGIHAVRDIDSQTGKTTIIALHVADPKNLDWWFTNIIQNGAVTDFDVIGFSYYHIWHTSVSFNDLPALVTSLKNKFYKDIMILETAYPFTSANNDSYSNIYNTQAQISGYPYTIDGQKSFLIDLTQKLMDAGAKGVMYWEPAWISSNMKDLWGTGSSWDNCTFFDFSGNLTEAVDYMDYNYSKK